MSCGTTLDDIAIFSGAEGHEPADRFVWVFTDITDFAYGCDGARVAKMRRSPYFTESDTEAGGNFARCVKEGYDHGPVAGATAALLNDTQPCPVSTGAVHAGLQRPAHARHAAEG